MDEEIFAKGKLFELVHTTQPDGRVFEVARRAPGVRLIIFDKDSQKLLLTKEFRKELDDWDYRLAGGKVFDSLDEYEAHRAGDDDIIKAAEAKAIAEAHEEAGVNVEELKLYKKSVVGATVEWDLYVFEATKWKIHEDGQALEAGEEIEADTWVSPDEARRMIMDAKMQEERIALILLQWLEEKSL